MMSYLEQVRYPDKQPCSDKTQHNIDSHYVLQNLHNNPKTNYASCSNLSSTVTNNNRPLYETVKWAIQDYVLPPTAI